MYPIILPGSEAGEEEMEEGMSLYPRAEGCENREMMSGRFVALKDASSGAGVPGERVERWAW